MAVQQVYIDDKAGIDTAITGYLNQGYTLANRTETGAIMQKTKSPLSAAMIILGLIIPIFGWAFLIGYLIIHASKPRAQVVELTVGVSHA